MTKDELVAKWTKRRSDLINPDGMTWDDLGFDGPPDGYDSVEACLESDPDGESDAEDQIELRLIDEFLSDLKEASDFSQARKRGGRSAASERGAQ